MTSKRKTPKWVLQVHAYGIESGEDIRVELAVLRFGSPPSCISPRDLLEHAVVDGMFRRRQVLVDGRREIRYVAVQSDPRPTPAPIHAASYFDGMRRVRSVFELGATL